MFSLFLYVALVLYCFISQVVRPTKYGKAFMKAWASHAKEDSLAGTDDQGRAMSVSLCALEMFFSV